MQSLAKPLELVRVNVFHLLRLSWSGENLDEVRAKDDPSERKFGAKIEVKIGEDTRYWTCSSLDM